jgi:hypothetical protein
MWHRVDVVLTDVSEEHIASIFRVEVATVLSVSSPGDFLIFSFYPEDSGDMLLRNVG